MLPRRIRLSTLLALIGAALLVMGWSLAPAAPRGEWTRITELTDPNIYEVGLARTPDGVLHVAWLRKNGTLRDLMHSSLDSNGRLAGSPATIVSGWNELSNPSLLVTGDGRLEVFFGGMRSLQPTEKLNGAACMATSDGGGTSWKVLEHAVSKSTSVMASPVGAVLARDGTPITTWAITGNLGVHTGLDPRQPDQNHQTACCAYQPALAVDSQSGEVVLGWFSNATHAGGMLTKTVAPSAGPEQFLPGSATPDRNSAVSIMQRFAITGRQGASGVYVAYGAGYPTFKAVNLWRQGGSAPTVVAKGANIRQVNIASAPEGRLWVMWADGNRPFAVRSNKAATRFGAIISVAPPVGTDSLYKLKGEGSLGPLDLFAAVEAGPNKLATWHTRVFPGLSLRVQPAQFAAGQGAAVTFEVTDAGDAVPGATITAGGKTATTDSQGRAIIQFPKGTSVGVLTATATKQDYTEASAKIRVVPK